ncbi:MAG: 16S rRNA (cytidine(1402)-2'-O)-methyltransferase [Deltaproteobacteria bacterium]|jgi:16S rRNA (cytidine1402-2'-O)-methyltransferase|nr:16S rRNA (cytidine(1402)-2'-O)-methyltransferase [Deltaproteobacteria bacterium]MBW2520447.1 16S rRNA (cytidine(1402)-2'-O)-methyltransferase [Deltaproteobacteria bacterium]
MRPGKAELKTQGLLYLVATPIGNLEDITFRAVRVLSEVDLIAAEDTRHSRKLLSHYQIQTPLLSYHEHNERKRTPQLIDKLNRGINIALISDAGTPCVADPGYRLVSACQAAGIRVVPVPGPSALIAALCVAGLPTDSFLFQGYLPTRQKARLDLLRKLQAAQRTLVFYEAPHRLIKSLNDIAAVYGDDCPMAIARELTKRHEEIYRGTACSAQDYFQSATVKGELVLLLTPDAADPPTDMHEALRQMLSESGLPRRQVVKIIASEYAISSREVYKESLKLREES